MFIDNKGAIRIRFNPCIFKTNRRGVHLSSHSYQRRSASSCLPSAKFDPDPLSGSLNCSDCHTSLDHNAPLFKCFRQKRRHILAFHREDAGQHFKNDHLHIKLPKHRGKFTPNDPPPNNRNFFGNVVNSKRSVESKILL